MVYSILRYSPFDDFRLCVECLETDESDGKQAWMKVLSVALSVTDASLSLAASMLGNCDTARHAGESLHMCPFTPALIRIIIVLLI